MRYNFGFNSSAGSNTSVQSVTGLNTDNTDPQNPIVKLSVGSGISGDGTPLNPLTVSGGSINYSNVVFVDIVNGNNSTALINRFDKPFINITDALTAASALPSISATNRALVYIRRGEYVSPLINLANNVDIYCESGVVFTNTPIIRDNSIAVNANIYGNLKISAFVGTAPPFDIRAASTVTFEFDSINSQAAAIQVLPSSSGGKVIIKGNYIYSNTLGQGFGMTFRNEANVTMNIANAIEATHSVIQFRSYTGTTVINCPNINLLAGNIYGGNFKQAVLLQEGSTTGKVTINGDIVNKDTVDYGGIGSLVTLFNNAIPKLTINGNIYGGVIKALDGNTAANGLIEINGNMSSSKDYTVWAYGNGQIVIKGSIIINNNTVGSNFAIAVNGTAKVFFKDCYISNTRTDSDIIVINGVATNLVLDGCQLFSPGASGSSISSTVGNVIVRVNNSRFNKAVTINITDLLSPSGITIDANIITPLLIN